MIPEVKKCSVEQCFYNRDMMCNAHAILVGSTDPVCETFTSSQDRINRRGQSDVGACHVDQCVFNMSKSCHACDDIEVNWQSGNALCTTYRPR